MFKLISNAFMFLSDDMDDPIVRMVEIEYSQEFLRLQRLLGHRPTRRDVDRILAG